MWLYLASAISIFIVRQVSLSSSFVSARDLSGVYLGAALCGAAVAVSARPTSREHRLTRLLPSAVGLLGVIDLLAGSLPNPVNNLGVLHDLLVGPTEPRRRRTLKRSRRGSSSSSPSAASDDGAAAPLWVSGAPRRRLARDPQVIGAVVSDFSVAATVACVLVVA